jgi:DNA binding domain, excisionase family
MNTSTPWLTAKEAADYMSVHPEALYVHLQRGELRSVKVGRRYRLKPEWCDEFLRGDAL